MQQLSAKVVAVELSRDGNELATLRFKEATSPFFADLKVPNIGRYRLGDNVVYYRGDVAVDEPQFLVGEILEAV